MTKTSYNHIRKKERCQSGKERVNISGTFKYQEERRYSGERRDGKKNDTHHRKGNTDCRQSLLM
jgi:hypothetical protein